MSHKMIKNAGERMDIGKLHKAGIVIIRKQSKAELKNLRTDWNQLSDDDKKYGESTSGVSQ